MSLDGRFIANLARELDDALTSGRINKIYQLGKADFLFLIRAKSTNQQLFISLLPHIARIRLSMHAYDHAGQPGGFAMFLRKHLEGAAIQSISSLQSERIIVIKLENTSESGEIVTLKMIIELFGKYANLIVTDEADVIMECYEHISPFEGKDRSFMKGIHYEFPAENKLDPLDEAIVSAWFDEHQDESPRMIVDAFRGISPLLAQKFQERVEQQSVDKAATFLALTNHGVEPTAAIEAGKAKFYYFDLFDTLEKTHYPTLSALLDEHFFEVGKYERQKQIAKNVYAIIKRELDRNRDKLEKLAQDLAASHEADQMRIQGDLILQMQNEMKKGQSTLIASSYEHGGEMKVAINPLLTPSENAQAYYRKYKKLKSATFHIEGQMSLTHLEIRYFEQLLAQLEDADLPDILEIEAELVENKYLRAKPNKKKITKFNFDTYIMESGTSIVVGKNNYQNAHITHKLGLPNEWWFHAKDIPGSHVLVQKTGELVEAEIRAAANLAAYYSRAKLSSSVPVDYTLIRYLKKVPGIKGHFVTMQNQKTIYIDPSLETIALLKKK